MCYYIVLCGVLVVNSILSVHFCLLAVPIFDVGCRSWWWNVVPTTGLECLLPCRISFRCKSINVLTPCVSMSLQLIEWWLRINVFHRSSVA